MARYFLEMAYRGSGFSGFQLQTNASTIQGEVNRALSVLLKQEIRTTGSSRTDAGVHARQNFVHFDAQGTLPDHFIYSLNAILRRQIVIRAVYGVPERAHARYDAGARSYRYSLYKVKDPFLEDFGYYFPFHLDIAVLKRIAGQVRDWEDFEAFSKRNSQSRTSICHIRESYWQQTGDNTLEFKVTADRFLRGMVRGLVGTMLKVGTGKMEESRFREVLEHKEGAKADFSVPPQGLILESITYPEGLMEKIQGESPG